MSPHCSEPLTKSKVLINVFAYLKKCHLLALRFESTRNALTFGELHIHAAFSLPKIRILPRENTAGGL